VQVEVKNLNAEQSKCYDTVKTVFSVKFSD
jgi:hypothetical protein